MSHDQNEQQKRLPSRYSRQGASDVAGERTSTNPRYPRSEEAATQQPRYNRERPSTSQRTERREPSSRSRRPTSRSKYQNPTVNHRVNRSETSDLGTFFTLLFKIIIAILVGFTAIYFLLRLLIPMTPYSIEQSWGNSIARTMISPSSEVDFDDINAYLQNLAENLVKEMDVPEDMPIHIHYIPMREANAFATLGGHIFVTQGLIKTVNTENGLAMVLAHELAHVKHRDPLTSLSSGIIFQVVLAVVFGGSGGDDLISGLTTLSFSRQQESQADTTAIKALLGLYGHTHGADEFFTTMLRQHGSSSSSIYGDFFSTHPDTSKRLDVIRLTQVGVPPKLVMLPKHIKKYGKPYHLQ